MNMYLHVQGTVVARGEGTINDNIETGTIEVSSIESKLINEAKTTAIHD